MVSRILRHLETTCDLWFYRRQCVQWRCLDLARNKSQKKKQLPVGIIRGRRIQGCTVEHHLQLWHHILPVWRIWQTYCKWTGQIFVIFLSFTICLFVCFYHYSKMPPTHILILTLAVVTWVRRPCSRTSHPAPPRFTEYKYVYLLLNMIIYFIINLHIEGDMYEYVCTELSACIFGKDMFVD